MICLQNWSHSSLPVTRPVPNHDRAHNAKIEKWKEREIETNLKQCDGGEHKDKYSLIVEFTMCRIRRSHDGLFKNL